MCILRTLSWNLRTFGEPEPPEQALRAMAEIICNLRADIVTIQEVQIGQITSGQIGAPIASKVLTCLQAILALLQSNDPAAGWALRVSGSNNSERAKSMSDAYAFFWKVFPARSKFSHDDPVQLVTCLQEPVILRREDGNLKGRRPGMMVLDITAKAGDLPIPLKVISWHAPTPCNTIGKYGVPSAGRGILDLAYLGEIGGSTMQSGHGGWKPREPVEVNPLPEVDTMLLADTNYRMDAARADEVYYNLNTNYTPCVSWPGHIVLTTYSSDPTKPFVTPSSYDNIFILKGHGKWKPSFTFTGNSGAYDFITAAAEALGIAAEIKYYPTDTAWYVIFQDQYKRQYMRDGISDHMPVWADFKVNRGSGAGSSAIKPTDGANNNCAFHAIFGALSPFTGLYTDPTAATRRTEFANWLAMMDATALETIRQDLLSSMIEIFGAYPSILSNLYLLLSDATIRLSAWPLLGPAMAAYISGIRNGRMLLWHEVSMIATWKNISIKLWAVDRGQYFSHDLNSGHGAPIQIYHFGVHFFRYDPS